MVRVNGSLGPFGVDADQASAVAFGFGDLGRVFNAGDEVVKTGEDLSPFSVLGHGVSNILHYLTIAAGFWDLLLSNHI